MLKNCPDGGASAGPVAAADGAGGAGVGDAPLACCPPRPRPPPPPSPHVPEKSGLPSAVRGVGAVRSGFPSGVFGTPVGYDGHCAKTATPPATKRLATATELIEVLIFPSFFHAASYQNRAFAAFG